MTRFLFDRPKGEWAEFDLEFPSDTPKLLLLGLIERVGYFKQGSGWSLTVFARPLKTASSNTSKDLTDVSPSSMKLRMINLDH